MGLFAERKKGKTSEHPGSQVGETDSSLRGQWPWIPCEFASLFFPPLRCTPCLLGALFLEGIRPNLKVKSHPHCLPPPPPYPFSLSFASPSKSSKSKGTLKPREMLTRSLHGQKHGPSAPSSKARLALFVPYLSPELSQESGHLPAVVSGAERLEPHVCGQRFSE